MKRTRNTTLLLALAGLTFWVAAPAQATETDMIIVDNQVVMRIRAGVDGYSPVDVGDAVRSRLASALAARHVAPSDVTVRTEETGGNPAIYVRDQLVIQVSPTLAEANNMRDPEKLARIWADNLRTTLPRVFGPVNAQTFAMR